MIAFTIGTFDRVGQDEAHLFYKMRKDTLKDPHIFISDDWIAYKRLKQFPSQDYEHRIKCCSYFGKTAPANDIINVLPKLIQEHERVVLYLLKDDPDAKSVYESIRAQMKHLNIQVRWIKPKIPDTV